MSLTKMQQLFVMEYCADPKLGKAEAARRAGCSETRAKITACEWMKNAEIQEAIQRKLDKRFAKLELTPNLVIAELDAIRDAAIESGSGAWQSQTRIKVAELKGRYLGMFRDKLEIGVDEELIKRLEAGRKRAFAPAEVVIPAQLSENNEQPSAE